MITYSITIKTQWGVYNTLTKDFNGKAHLNNWCSLMERKGNKVIGAESVHTD
jgi:hypothetical protein